MLGAGMMGAAIAYVCAKAGIEVVLKDVSQEAAEKGKAYSREAARARPSRAAARRRRRPTRCSPGSRRPPIRRTAAGADLVIEAVFEDPAVKARGVRRDRAAPRRRTRCSAPTPRRCRSPTWPRACRGPRTSSACTSSARWTRCRCWRSSRARRPSDETLYRALDVAKQIRRRRSSSTTAAASSPAA